MHGLGILFVTTCLRFLAILALVIAGLFALLIVVQFFRADPYAKPLVFSMVSGGAIVVHFILRWVAGRFERMR
jgi:hypothetical protein